MRDLDIKQVIVIRRDLNSRRGKEISQGCHASMAFLIERFRKYERESEANTDFYINDYERWWMDNGHKKVCVQVTTKEELLDIYQKACSLGLETHIIKDEGLTEYKQPEYTALAIGPHPGQFIDTITRDLKLY